MIRRYVREHPAIWLWLPPLVIALFDARYHEYWRDEASPVLVARALPWSLFWTEMRIEGIPFLFHALAKVVVTVLAPAWTLLFLGFVGSCVLLFGTYRLLLSISGASGRSVAMTLVLSMTYAYGYELGAVVRSYSLGLGLAFFAFAYLREALRREDKLRLLAGVLFAMASALTSAHSACVAGGALASFVILAFTKRGGFRLAWPAALAIPAFLLTYWVARPFAGRVREYNGAQARAIVPLVKLGLQAILSGLAPSDWWYVEFLPALRSHAVVAELRSLSVVLLAMGALWAIVLRAPLMWRRPQSECFDLVAIVIGWAPLTVIVAMHYWGSYRHHLFFSIPAVVLLSGWALEERIVGRASRLLRRSFLLLAAPWLLHQIGLGAASFALDLTRPFSDTKAFAARLPKGGHVVSETDWGSVGLLLWRPDLVLSAANGGGRHYRYLITDGSWHRGVARPPLIQSECRTAPDRVFFVGAAASGARPLGRCLTPFTIPNPASSTIPQSWENISMWSVDCDCALSIAYPPSFFDERDDDDRR